jgi:hypothetical protein
MKKNKFRIHFFLCALILQAFIVNEAVANMSDIEFKNITGSEVEDVFCLGSNVDVKSHNWSKLVANIQLKINVEKYMSQTLKRIKKNKNDVSSHKEKYRKIKIKLDGTDCWMSGKYRMTGDLLDHVGSENEIIHSIKVKMTNGKIDNILKFKLFAPKSRMGKLEVLNSIIHQKLGLLAPRTALINVQIGGQTYKAIFQEDITEQLLEHNSLHESMILEGDEGYVPFNFPKIINRSFVANERFRNISLYVLHELGQGYHNTSVINKKIGNDSPIRLDFLPTSSKEEFIYFHLLNLSLNSIDGLTLDDSRFVFDHISRRFHPIYYDGHAREIISKVSDINFDIPGKIRIKLLEDLEALNLIKLKSELKDLGAKFTLKELQKIINEAISFIKITEGKKSFNLLKEDPEKSTGTKFIQKAAQELIKKNKLSSLQVSWILNSDEFKKCIYYENGKNCISERLKYNQKFALHLEPQSLTSGIFLHGLYEEAINAPYFQELEFNTLTLKGTGTIIEHTSNLILSINYHAKTIKVSSRHKNVSTSQIKVSKGILDGWTFRVEEGVFLGYEKYPGTRASKFGLTGCITFHDMSVKSLKVQMKQTMCEDSIHFVRTKGDIKSINIENALADAVDADFSNLVFNDLIVSDAGNDCVDFSAGIYKIIKSNFHKCGDKGVSAGEGSEVVLISNETKGALIGMVAKDGSKVKVKEAALFDVKVCLAAYKKKQEFGPARLDVDKIRCSSDKYFNQNGSQLYIN